MIEVYRMNTMNLGGKTKAFVDLHFFGLLLKGFRVVEGEKGLFVSYPDEKGKDGQYYPTILPLNEEMKKQVSEVILKHYGEKE